MTQRFPDPAEGPPAICVVVVNWNTRELLRACLESLVRFPASESTEVRVVDNGSEDGSVEMLRSDFPNVILHEPGANLGFSAANNLAMRETAAEVVVLLNPDAEVMEGTLDRVVAAARAGYTAAPRLLNSDGSLQHSCFRFPGLLTDWLEALYLHLILPRGVRGRLLLGGHWAHDEERTVDWAIGACLAVTRAALEKAGLLPEEYFIFGEDQEWCWRLARAGYPVRYLPDARVIHHGNQAGAQLEPAWRIRKTHEGQDRYLADHHPGLRGRLIRLGRMTGYRVRSLILGLLGRGDEAKVYRHILQVLRTAPKGGTAATQSGGPAASQSGGKTAQGQSKPARPEDGAS